jgi:hypothetical protein
LPASGRFYQVTEADTGWTTGLRQSINATFEISGSAVGQGTYNRYTDMNFDEVRARERVAASNGSLDTSEFIRLVATPIDPVEVTLMKFPGSQIYRLTVNETWPVYMFSRRNIDYIGKGISDRDFLGNNLDYIGASHLYVKDLKKERASFLELKNAWFEAIIDNETSTILLDRFMPDKTTDYRLKSRFQGHAVLKYRQAAYDRTTAKEGVEDYWGSFAIDRHVTMRSSGRNASEMEAIWLPCCSYGANTSLQVADPEAYQEVDAYQEVGTSG